MSTTSTGVPAERQPRGGQVNTHLDTLGANALAWTVSMERTMCGVCPLYRIKFESHTVSLKALH